MITTVTLNTAIDKLYLVDSLTPKTVMRVKEVNNTAGGKGLNVSRVASLAGENVTAMGFVGGYNGKLFKSLIKESNITPAFSEVSGETRCCINIMDESNGKSTEFLEPGRPVEEKDIESFLKDFKEKLKSTDVVTISGSMPKGTPKNFYATLVAEAKKAEKPIILDASGEALKEGLEANPTMIKPNTDEIQQILNVDINSREDLINAGIKLHEKGIPIIAISLGKDGVLVVSKEGVFHGITPDIKVVNTVGCGDSMVAGFAVSISRGYSIEETIKFAVTISTANALTKGTGSYLQSDFDKILPLVSVEKLK